MVVCEYHNCPVCRAPIRVIRMTIMTEDNALSIHAEKVDGEPKIVGACPDAFEKYYPTHRVNVAKIYCIKCDWKDVLFKRDEGHREIAKIVRDMVMILEESEWKHGN